MTGVLVVELNRLSELLRENGGKMGKIHFKT